MTELRGSVSYMRIRGCLRSYLGGGIFRDSEISHRHSRSFSSENDLTRNLQKSYLPARRWPVLVYKEGDDRLDRVGWGLGSVVEGIL
jgi:hypothetical protein